MVVVEDYKVPWESILLSLWPKLKAVIERSAVRFDRNGPAMNRVWIVAENALRFDEVANDNPIAHIIQALYGTQLRCSAMARDSLNIAYPKFATEHNICDKLSSVQTATRTQRSMSGPSLSATDATLTDQLLLGLRFHIVDIRGRSSLLPADPLKFAWIWRLCCISRAALQTSKFFVKVVCDKWKGILDWLIMVGVFVCLDLAIANPV
jgi:hypothetical protein